jgi:hypothetical protein
MLGIIPQAFDHVFEAISQSEGADGAQSGWFRAPAESWNTSSFFSPPQAVLFPLCNAPQDGSTLSEPLSWRFIWKTSGIC